MGDFPMAQLIEHWPKPLLIDDYRHSAQLIGIYYCQILGVPISNNQHKEMTKILNGVIGYKPPKDRIWKSGIQIDWQKPSALDNGKGERIQRVGICPPMRKKTRTKQKAESKQKQRTKTETKTKKETKTITKTRATATATRTTRTTTRATTRTPPPPPPLTSPCAARTFILGRCWERWSMNRFLFAGLLVSFHNLHWTVIRWCRLASTQQIMFKGACRNTLYIYIQLIQLIQHTTMSFFELLTTLIYTEDCHFGMFQVEHRVQSLAI